MSFLNRFRRKKEDEATRITRILKSGRIIEGTVIDIAADGSDQITHIFYRYNIAGVDYESSQALSPEQQERPIDYAPGARIVIRYDPRQPGNSVVV